MFLEKKRMNNEKRLSSIELRFTGCAEDRFTNALKKQMELHEGVTLMDLLKFLHQSSLGPFHIFEMMDETQIMDWIRKNLKRAKPSDGPLVEELYGKKWVRINLESYKKRFGNDYQKLYEIFVDAKSMKEGRLSEYRELLRKLVNAIRNGKIQPKNGEPKILSLVEDFLKEYEKEDYPPIHHSETYMLRNNSEYLVVPHSSLDKIA